MVILVAIPFLVWLGFCQGWWLQQNLWAHYWWQCQCGPEFEQSLYPDNVEIIVSACRDPRSAVISPDGRYMVVKLRDTSEEPEFILLDLVNGQEKPFPYLPAYARADEMGFWTDTLFLAQEENSYLKIKDETNRLVQEYDNDFKLVDVTNDKILNLTVLKDFSEALEAFQGADRVLVRLGDSGWSTEPAALALAVDPTDKFAENYVLTYPKRRTFPESQLKFFSENNINYEISDPCWVPASREKECVSHNSYFVVKYDEICTIGGQPITSLIKKYRPLSTGVYGIGWSHNDDGFYMRLGRRYIIESGWITPAYFPIPQPIVKLKVPEDYLQPTPSPKR